MSSPPVNASQISMKEVPPGHSQVNEHVEMHKKIISKFRFIELVQKYMFIFLINH